MLCVDSVGIGKVLNWDYRQTAKEEGITINEEEGDDLSVFPVEKARIRSVWYFIVGAISATIGFGWSIEAQVHLSCALVMTAVCGVSFTGVFNVSKVSSFAISHPQLLLPIHIFPILS